MKTESWANVKPVSLTWEPSAQPRNVTVVPESYAKVYEFRDHVEISKEDWYHISLHLKHYEALKLSVTGVQRCLKN